MLLEWTELKNCGSQWIRRLGHLGRMETVRQAHEDPDALNNLGVRN